MPSPTAAEILERTRKLYATCRTYLDEGEQTTVFITGDKPHDRRTNRKLFRTAYDRGGEFYFEYREVALGPESEWKRGVVWTKAGRANLWWSIGSPFDSQGDLEKALGGFAGVSNGASVDVPAMLMPDILSMRTIPNPRDAVFLGVSELDRVECARIEGRPHERHALMVAWIDLANGALLRTEERKEFTVAYLKEQEDAVHRSMLTQAALTRVTPEQRELYLKHSAQYPPQEPRPFTTESTTTWRPRFDVDIDPATFEFTPPS